MDIFFFLLSLFCAILGCANILLLFLVKGRAGDRGTSSLLIPLLPLNVITIMDTAGYYLAGKLDDSSMAVFTVSCEAVRVITAYGWVFFTYYHYALNRVDIFRKRKVLFFTVLAFILLVLAPLSLLADCEQFRLTSVIHTVVICMFYFAGIKAVLILTKTGSLLVSSRTALSIAIISMVVNPLISAGDYLNWKIPFLDPGIPFWVQAHPVYFFLVNIPLALYLLRLFRSGWLVEKVREVPVSLQNTPTLSDREREVLVHLYQGERYSEIAEKLFISLPTVKTHVLHIYQKLGISRRSELYSMFKE